MNPDPSVLTAMITPAVLISACGALILSTSVRLGRVVDRVRALADRFEELSRKDPSDVELFEDRMELTFTQLDWLTTRARHLQRAMTTFYLALGLFVATTVTMGFVGMTGKTGKAIEWIPVVFGMVGAALLFIGALLLAFEATLALRSVHSEMDFLWKLGKHHAPEPLVRRIEARRFFRGPYR
jgi:heme A synthase